MNHKDFSFLATLIMLLIELLEELFVGSNFVNSTFFQPDFTKRPHPKRMVQSKYVLLFFSFQGHMMTCALRTLSKDLGHSVKPSITTWFYQISLVKYDEDWWVKYFHMTKETLFNIVEKLHPIIHKQDTKYKKIIPIQICVSCALYKLTQGAIFLTCCELFAMEVYSFSCFAWICLCCQFYLSRFDFLAWRSCHDSCNGWI